MLGRELTATGDRLGFREAQEVLGDLAVVRPRRGGMLPLLAVTDVSRECLLKRLRLQQVALLVIAPKDGAVLLEVAQHPDHATNVDLALRQGAGRLQGQIVATCLQKLNSELLSEAGTALLLKKAPYAPPDLVVLTDAPVRVAQSP